MDRTPFGHLLYEADRQHALAQLQHDRRFDQVSDAAIQQAFDCLTRDEHLRAAGGRWTPGRPDPPDFVPGDIAAIRVGAGKPILISDWRTLPDQRSIRIQLQRRDLRHHPMKALDLVELTTAVPYFIPTTAALGVLASRPPDPQLLGELRLPFQQVLVVFGSDLELDPSTYRWPADYPYHLLRRHTITYQLIDRGGYVSGMVLLGDHHGRLRDDLLWIIAANPDPTLPPPANLDRIRGVLRGWRSAATLAPLVTNIAAAIAWGAWQPPTTPLPLPGDPTSKQWRKATRRGTFRRRESRGDALGVHIIDLGRTHTSSQPEPTTAAAARHPPIPHLRGGHFRRVRVGPHHDWHYQIRWIAPTLVRGDQPSTNRLVVRRLPPPPARGQRQDSRDFAVSNPKPPRIDLPQVHLASPDDPHPLDLP